VFDAPGHRRHEFLCKREHVMRRLARIGDDAACLLVHEVAQHAQAEIEVLVEQCQRRRRLRLFLDAAPQPAQILEVRVEFALGSGFRHRAYDESAPLLGRQQQLQFFAQVLAFLFVLDALRDADMRLLRQVNQETSGDSDLRGQPCALGADRILDDLHQETLSLGQQLLDRHATSPFWRLPQMSATCRNAARSPPMSTNADCMPGSTRTTRPM
jgi:hypothetical protein